MYSYVSYKIQPGDSLWHIAQRFSTTVAAIFAVNPGVDINRIFVGQTVLIPQSSRVKPKHCISKAELNLRSKMRLLWEQHVAWTRMTIISLAFNLPNADFVTSRLLRNATDNGNSLRPYYGDVAANTYSDLIKQHLILAADLVKAAVAGNEKVAADTEKKWYANADEIAVFLHSINPFLSEEVVRKMFYEHLALTKLEAIRMIAKDYKADIEVFDQIEAQALEMADAISGAIIKQFPKMFRSM